MYVLTGISHPDAVRDDDKSWSSEWTLDNARDELDPRYQNTIRGYNYNLAAETMRYITWRKIFHSILVW